jgi:hypothetical protein
MLSGVRPWAYLANNSHGNRRDGLGMKWDDFGVVESILNEVCW